MPSVTRPHPTASSIALPRRYPASRRASRRAALLVALLLVGLLPALPAPASTGMPLVAAPSVTLVDAQEWASSKRTVHPRFVEDIVPALFCAALRQAAANGGRAIDPAILVAQSAHETGWGNFGGVVPPTHHNTAGIKIANTRLDSDTDPEQHERFADWADGARGHTNHLAAYTGLAPVGTPHGRYRVVLTTPWAGSIRTVEELGARWAPSGTYGQRVASLTSELRGFARGRPSPAPCPEAAPLEPAPLSPDGPAGMSTLTRRSSGAEVLALQLLLAERDPSFDHSSGPGVYGPRTEAAVKAVQREIGVKRTGRADRCVWEALWPTATAPAAVAGRSAAGMPRLRAGDCGADVALLNALLEARDPDFDAGPTPAVYGAATVAEVKALQRELRIKRTGRADTAVWAALLPGA